MAREYIQGIIQGGFVFEVYGKITCYGCNGTDCDTFTYVYETAGRSNSHQTYNGTNACADGRDLMSSHRVH